jgi:hypothetical protein
MSDTKKTNPTNPKISATPVRVIDNKAIRDRQREELAKSKKINVKKARNKKNAEDRVRRRSNEEQRIYAEEYMSKQDKAKLAVPLISPEMALKLSREGDPNDPQNPE